MSRRHVLPTVLLAVFMVLTSCSRVQQVAGMVQDLQKVRAELAKTLGFNEITVNLMNDRFLNIAVMNSPWNDLPADQKSVKALEIARLAYSSFPSRSALSSVSVTFGVQRTYLGVVNYSDSRDSFRFEAPKLTAESPASSPVAVH